MTQVMTQATTLAPTLAPTHRVAPRYIFEASEKPSLPMFDVPLIKATEQSVKDYGALVSDPDKFDIEIVPWPAQGWRPIDAGSGDEGGICEGIFYAEWDGDVLMASNEAVNGRYVLGWSCDPQQALRAHAKVPKENTAENITENITREHIILWHFNYHPDGGQLFFPLDKQPFVVPVALPGDDLKPAQVIAFWCEGSRGLYIHPGIWHDGIFPLGDSQRFLDRQGKVHARVSCDFGEEFGVYLKVPLTLPSG